MIKKLHLQLTILATIATTIILIIVSAVSLKISESHMYHANEYSMQNNFSTILNYLEEQTIISHRWLATSETNYNFYIYLNDNGQELLFDSLHQDPVKSRLLAIARTTAEEEHNFSLSPTHQQNSLSKTVSFPLSTEENANYYAFVSVIPKQEGYLSVIVLHSYSLIEAQILQQRTAFYIAISISFVLLGIFFYFLIGFLLKPIQKNREEQMRFIASASHELRSPLTVILSSLSAMKRAKNDEWLHFSDMIRSESERMALLIEDLLTLSQADSVTWNMNFKPAELDTLLLSIYEKYDSIAKTKQRKLSVDLPNTTLPSCVCDVFRIEQLLMILLDNAFSYTNIGDSISLSVQCKNNYFYINVSDTGPGIPDTDKAHVFERFYRLDKSRNDKSHFGLGLCIAKEIVLLHKGSIHVYDAVDGGAGFQVQIPVIS
jgi:Signal transduction histidine kinase